MATYKRYQGKEIQSTIKAPTKKDLDEMIKDIKSYARENGLGPVKILRRGKDPDGGYEAIVVAHNWNPVKWVKEKVTSHRYSRNVGSPEGVSYEEQSEELKALKAAEREERREEALAKAREKARQKKEKWLAGSPLREVQGQQRQEKERKLKSKASVARSKRDIAVANKKTRQSSILHGLVTGATKAVAGPRRKRRSSITVNKNSSLFDVSHMRNLTRPGTGGGMDLSKLRGGLGSSRRKTTRKKSKISSLRLI